MEIIEQLLQYIIHADQYLINFAVNYGTWTYMALFAIIFCETGLVITPFLPGDSLLFAAGSIAAQNDALNIQLMFFLLSIASILGNKLNYFIGRSIGPRIFTYSHYRLLNRNHLERAHRFYEKHGGKTIIFARFIPIIRTFAPFVAGIGYMSISRFTFYNIISGILWIGSLLCLGFFFGRIPIIKENFTLAIYCVIGLSLLPPILTFLYHKLKKEKATT